MKIYKLWVYVEEIDEENDSYEDAGEPTSIGEFKTFKEADEYREEIRSDGVAKGIIKLA